MPGSPVAVIVRLLISEGPRHPDLLDYYYNNVVSKGLALVKRIVSRGIERGEFRPSAVDDLPHLFLAPVMMSVVWRSLFAKQALDTDKLIDTQLELLLAHMKA